jgi:hypothetical protein
MSLFLRILLVCCAALSFAAPAIAQQDAKKPAKPYEAYKKPEYNGSMAEPTDAATRPYYEWMARQALAYKPPGFDFGLFRMYYTKTEHYDPFGDARREILDLAYSAKNEKNPKKREALLGAYAETLMHHMANLDVMTQAYVLAEEDRSMGDPEFFLWMRSGLIQSVLSSGDGVSLNRAYDVITMGEETALFKQLPVDMLRVENQESGGVYYNFHTVQDTKHIAPYTVFVNVTIPMAWLAEKKRREGVIYSIPKQ